MVRAHALTRAHRIRRRLDYKNLSEEGSRCVLSRLVIIYQENGLKHSRLGISVSREVGGSVIRSRLKRLIREFFRKAKANFSGLDMHVIVRPKRGGEIVLARLEKEVLLSLEQARQRLGRAA